MRSSGPPASGKRTQCALLADRLGAVHISVGSLLRELVDSGNEFADAIRSVLDVATVAASDPEQDAAVVKAVQQRLEQDDCCQRGWVLDGFPRSAAQAEQGSALLQSADLIVNLQVPQESLVERAVCA